MNERMHLFQLADYLKVFMTRILLVCFSFTWLCVINELRSENFPKKIICVFYPNFGLKCDVLRQK